MNWFTLVLIALASWRISNMFSSEDGPFDIFKRLRIKLGIEHHDDGTVAKVPANTLAKLISCNWCLSLWIGGIMYVIWLLSPIPVYIFAISALVCIISCLNDRVTR